MVRPLAASGAGDRHGGGRGSSLKPNGSLRNSNPMVKSCVVMGSLIIFTVGSLLCVCFVNLFRLTDFQLLYSLIAVDDPQDPLPADGHWFVWAVIMLAMITSVAGGFGYVGILMGRRSVLCAFSPVCLALCICYVYLGWHVDGAVGTLEPAMEAQVVEFCNASTEWAYTVKLGCASPGDMPEDVKIEMHSKANELINSCDDCIKDLNSLKELQMTHAVHACQILEHLCHHMVFEEVGRGRCLINSGDGGHVLPPVIKSGDMKLEGVDNSELLECCEQGCASVVGCAGFWYSDGHCALVSPHKPIFQHELKEYKMFCKDVAWDKLTVDKADMHLFLKDEATIEKTDDKEGITCWKKGDPRMIATFDRISRLMIVICHVACVILLLVSFCTSRYHYVLTQQKFPELIGNPLKTVCTMCSVPCEKARRRRRDVESRKRDELLGLDYSSDEYSSDSAPEAEVLSKGAQR